MGVVVVGVEAGSESLSKVLPAWLRRAVHDAKSPQQKRAKVYYQELYLSTENGLQQSYKSSTNSSMTTKVDSIPESEGLRYTYCTSYLS